ncbi:MAG: hypothetical protein K2L64_01525, partial [Ureaplasma sp.]|nr:hypothetical protein [Ureaplasma sp.]
IKIDDGYLFLEIKQKLDLYIKYLDLIKIQLESIAINPDYKKYLKISYQNSWIGGINDAK